MPTAAEWLDLDGVTARREGFRFDVLNQSHAVLGTAAVQSSPGSTPTLTNDINRPIRRTLEGVWIPPRPLHERDSALYWAEDIDTIAHRIKVVYVLDATGDEYPLGIFLFADASRHTQSFGSGIASRFVDQCVILEQRLLSSVGYQDGTVISTALAAQAAVAGIVATAIEATSKSVNADSVWAVGRDTRLALMEDLCAMAGYLAPYFDNDGTLICRSAPALAAAPPDVVYAAGSRIDAASLVESDDLLTAPNIYLAVDSAGVSGEVWGTFEVPASAPHSFANRGFYVVAEPVFQQGLADTAAAQDAAQAAYNQGSATYRWLTFSTPVDPRHDTFDVVEVGGERFREQSWSMQIAHGGRMDHSLRGIY